jgi:hypothetical protein
MSARDAASKHQIIVDVNYALQKQPLFFRCKLKQLASKVAAFSTLKELLPPAKTQHLAFSKIQSGSKKKKKETGEKVEPHHLSVMSLPPVFFSYISTTLVKKKSGETKPESRARSCSKKNQFRFSSPIQSTVLVRSPVAEKTVLPEEDKTEKRDNAS